MALETKGGAEHLADLFDGGVFTPLFASKEGAVSVAFGLVGGLGVYGICQNGGAMAAADVDLCCKTLDLAAKTGNPVVTLYNSKGAKLEEGLAGLTAAAKLTAKASKLSGVVPQISVVTGVCGASAALAAVGADLCIMTQEAELFLTSPFLSKAAGDAVADAGTADFAVKAGVAALVCNTATEAVKQAQKLLMMLPSNNLSAAAGFEYALPTQTLHTGKYTGTDAVAALADAESALELFAGFGKGAITALATIAGSPVGLVATNGADTYLGKECVARIARFVRLCDAFSVPVVTVINTGGFAKSNSAEAAGALREAARLASTYADATTAKVAVVTGKAVGTAYTALGSADLTIVLEGAVIAPVEPSAAVSILYKEEIQSAAGTVEAETAARVKIYETEVAGAAAAIASGCADLMADTTSLRNTVSSALDILASKREQRLPKKHGNMPL